MSLSCREDRMMICGIVLRQHRNVTDDRRHPHMPYSQPSTEIDGWLKTSNTTELYWYNLAVHERDAIATMNARPWVIHYQSPWIKTIRIGCGNLLDDGGNKRSFCPSIRLSVGPSVEYIANHSRTQRPGMSKCGRKVLHL